MSRIKRAVERFMKEGGWEREDEMSEIEEIKDRYGRCWGGEIDNKTVFNDVLILLSSLKKEKEQTEYFRLEVNRLTDELAKEKERISEAEFLRDGMQTRVNELFVENESLNETINFWKKSYNEELAHSKQVEEKVKELERKRGACEVCWTVSWVPIEKHEDANGVNTIGPDQLARCGYCWLEKKIKLIQEHADKLGVVITSQTEKRLKLEEKISELDDRIEKLAIIIDKYAGRIIKADERIKELETELRKGSCCNLICHAEKLQLEIQLASIKADESIGRLEVEGNFGEDD